MVEQDSEILRSTPCLVLFVFELLGLSLAVRAGSRIAGVMLNSQLRGAESGLGVVAKACRVNEDNAAPCGYAVGAGSSAQRCGACLGAVSNDIPRTRKADGLRGSGVVQRNDDLVPLAGLVVGDLPSSAAGNSGNSISGGVAKSGNRLTDRDKTCIVIRNILILGSACPIDRVHVVRGTIGVLIAVLGAAELGTCYGERNTLSGQSGGQTELDLTEYLGIGGLNNILVGVIQGGIVLRGLEAGGLVRG